MPFLRGSSATGNHSVVFIKVTVCQNKSDPKKSKSDGGFLRCFILFAAAVTQISSSRSSERVKVWLDSA